MLNRLTASHGSDLGDAGRLIAHVTAIFMLGAGVIHLSAASDHKSLPVMMVGFLIVALLQIAVGGLLLAGRPRRLLLWGAVALVVSSLGLWFASRTVGLPFLPGGHMEPIGFKDGVTVVFELAALPGLLMLMTRHLAGVALPAAFGSQALSVMGVGATLLMTPALMLGGGMHHSQEQMEAMGHEHGEAAEAGHDEAGHDEVAGAPGAGHPHGTGAGARGAAGGDEHAGGKGHAAHGAGSGHDDDKSLGDRMLARAGHDDHGAASASGGAQSGGAAHPHGSGSSGSSRSSGSGSSHRSHSGSGSSGSHDSDRSGDKKGDSHSDGDSHSGHDSGSDSGDKKGSDSHSGHDSGSGSGEHETHAAGHSHVDGCDPSYRQQYELLSVLGMRFIYQPGANGRNAAFRMCGPAPEDDITHEQAPGHCTAGGPTAEQQAYADRLVSETRRALAKYKNNWQLALEDGFKPFPIVEGRWVHMTNQERYADDTLIDPDRIDSFMFAKVGNDWIPAGGMYMYGDRSDPNPPNPTGCLLAWHRHASYEGYVATAAYTWDEAWISEKTMWMAHVWTYGGLDPWGRDFDGTEPASWSWPSSMLPVGCDRKNFCPTP